MSRLFMTGNALLRSLPSDILAPVTEVLGCIESLNLSD